MKLRLSARARTHYGDILRYTQKTFGSTQLDRYEARFQSAFETLLAHPEVGYSVDEIAEGLRMFGAGRHRIFYRIRGDFIDILAILHDSQLPGRFFAQ